MLIKSNVAEAVSSLHAGRLRTLFALLGIVIGIGSVIAMISVGEVYKNESIKRFKELGTDILTIRKLRSRNPGARASVRLADVHSLPAEESSIVASAAWISASGDFTHAGKVVGRGSLLGVTASFLDLRKLEIEAGRFISDLDFRRYYCVVGADIARAMRRAGTGPLVGKSLRLGGRMYTIVGVLRRSATTLNFNANGSVFVPITTAQRAFAQTELRDMIARMRPGVHHRAAATDVESYFRRKSRDVRLRVVSAKQLIEQIQQQTQLIALLLAAVGSISLIVGGVGVMNVMLVSVSQRRQEIGIRRALGARRKDIQFQFLTESIILSLLGGLFGIVLGIGSAYVICRYTGWTFSVSTAGIVLGVGVSAGVGIFFGLYPAYHAARLDPITALRSG